MTTTTLYPNTFQTHNFYVDELMHLLTAEEFKVLIFTVREIVGWKKNASTLRARIALSCFMDGTKQPEDGFHNHGTGLSVNTVRTCLDNLCRFGILIRHDQNSKGTEYELDFEWREVDVEGLRDRHAEWKSQAERRTAKATRVALGKRTEGIVA